jgi:arginine N-succinyltransferase
MLLARSRYLFIRRHRARFADRLLAELRGVIDEAGASPFWDGLAGRFFGMNFQRGRRVQCDQRPPVHRRSDAQAPDLHRNAPDRARRDRPAPPSGRAAMRMLESEGFAFEGYLDIFDGGPTMTAQTDQVHSVRDATRQRRRDRDGEAAQGAAGDGTARRFPLRLRQGERGRRRRAIDPVCAGMLAWPATRLHVAHCAR